MSTYSFSVENNAFYPVMFKNDYVNAGTWPTDAVEVDDDIYNEYAANSPPIGKRRVAGEDGLPVWEDIPPETKEEMVLRAKMQKSALISSATDFITPLQDAVDLGMENDKEVDLLLAWKKYRVLLNRVDVLLAPDIDWPEKP